MTPAGSKRLRSRMSRSATQPLVDRARDDPRQHARDHQPPLRRTAASCTWSRRPGGSKRRTGFPDDTNTLYFNSGGKLYKVQAEPSGHEAEPGPPERTPEAMDLGMLTRINNDHGITPRREDCGRSAINRRPIERPSSIPRSTSSRPAAARSSAASPNSGPSYFHGWSPDGDDAHLLRGAQRQLRRLQPSPSMAVRRSGSRPPRAKTTARSIRRTGSTSTSIRIAAGRCRSGG